MPRDKRDLIDRQDDHARRVERGARRIAEIQLERLDELALIGYPIVVDEIARDVVYEALRAGAEAAIDR